MRALLDVNVLIAMLDADHVSHAAATDWFSENARNGWATCPITQNGCVRIMSSRAYPNPVPCEAIVVRLREACAHQWHEFWTDGVSVLDADVFDPSRIHGPRQLTDVYLLALALMKKGKFVTFDASIATGAVRKARPSDLIVI